MLPSSSCRAIYFMHLCRMWVLLSSADMPRPIDSGLRRIECALAAPYADILD